MIYARVLARAGRWDEAQAVLEEVWKADTQDVVLHNSAARELAFVLASQGHRDQAFRALGLAPYSNNLGLRAHVEAALGERERAMELLREHRENGSGGIGGPHGPASNFWFSSLWDYPPFQEFIGAGG